MVRRVSERSRALPFCRGRNDWLLAAAGAPMNDGAVPLRDRLNVGGSVRIWRYVSRVGSFGMVSDRGLQIGWV